MDRNAIAAELARLGRDDFRLIAKMERNRARRCELLSAIACHPDAGLDGGVSTNATAPKEPGE